MVHDSTPGGWQINMANALANYVGQNARLPGKIAWPATALAGGPMSTFGIEDDVVPAHVVAGRAEITRGSRVRLHPRPRADILDLALAGRVAFVEAIEQDFEGALYDPVDVTHRPDHSKR